MLDRKILLLDHASVERFLPQEQWLSNLVAVRLLHQNEPVGALLAINKAGGKDFEAIDLQMLQLLADRCSIYLQDLNALADLQELLIALLRSLVNSIDSMDPYTSGHSERVALVARRLAEQMTGTDPAFCQRAYFGGLLHDVGKIAIPGAVLRKSGTLNPEELALIRRHPADGARLIEHIRGMHDIVPAIIGHHERIDGKGYPAGTGGDALDPLAPHRRGGGLLRRHDQPAGLPRRQTAGKRNYCPKGTGRHRRRTTRCPHGPGPAEHGPRPVAPRAGHLPQRPAHGPTADQGLIGYFTSSISQPATC